MLALSVFAFLVSIVLCLALMVFGKARARLYGRHKPQRFHHGHVPRFGGLAIVAGCGLAWCLGAAAHSLGMNINVDVEWDDAARWLLVLAPVVAERPVPGDQTYVFAPDAVKGVDDPVGKFIKINGVFFEVIGMHRKKATANMDDDQDATIYVPFTTFKMARIHRRVALFEFNAADDEVGHDFSLGGWPVGNWPFGTSS